MKNGRKQLVFDLASSASLGFENFFVSESNNLAAQGIKKWKFWTNRKLILLGPKASGKSHLANSWALESDAVHVSSRDLLSKDFIDLDKNKALIIENIDEMLGRVIDQENSIEEALFHLFNSLSQSSCYLLITATLPVKSWSLRIPDLISRLKSCEKIELMPPDDRLLMAVMLKQFEDKQISASPELIAFASKRIRRTFESVRKFVTMIDELTLREKREVTIPVATFVLDELDEIDKDTKF